MKTRFINTLAIVLTSLCGATLIGADVASAQTDNGFTATPLPPLPQEYATPSKIDDTQQLNTAKIPELNDSSESGRLFSILPAAFQAPPVPAGFEATARIVRLEDKPNQIDEQTKTFPTQIANSTELIYRSPAPEARVAKLPNVVASEDSSDSSNYIVSFAKTAQEDEIKPELGPASPELDTPDSSEATSPQPDDGDAESDGLADLESQEEKTDRDERNRERQEEDDDVRGQDDDRSDDLDDLDLDDDDRPRRKSRQFGVWPKKSIQEVSIDVRDTSGDVPKDESSVLNASSQRYFGSDGKTEKVFAWAAPNIRYQPLYFEDVALERYGQTKGLVKQPIVSAFKFLRDGALLPLNAKIDNPYDCDTSLGFCRPGSPTAAGCGCAKCQQR